MASISDVAGADAGDYVTPAAAWDEGIIMASEQNYTSSPRQASWLALFFCTIFQVLILFFFTSPFWNLGVLGNTVCTM